MSTFLLILLFIAISFLDYKDMLKTKKVKVIVIYTGILGIAFILSELHLLEKKLIGLNQIVAYIMRIFV
ncbi:hypothetical protein EKG37_19815 [Robertmurraya yapensis]|uniref:Uncharacterized protein n=1 Tax=Bacillus yapensis TaxID=2492960 RepID=A0A3S0I8F4_9BACI|nr:hypothetical protein EKG37_19815 [Bacillus yapensis]TKS93979.1 hypothetical protein FAR12_19820 [Bacillus yapensis]